MSPDQAKEYGLIDEIIAPSVAQPEAAAVAN